MDEATKQVKSTRSLPCQLTGDEKIEYGNQLADHQYEIERIEDRKKAAVSQYKSETDGCTANIRELSRKIRDGYEHRDVECIGTYDWTNGEITYTRPDTGETVEVKEIPEYERQQKLNLDAKPLEEDSNMSEEDRGLEDLEGTTESEREDLTDLDNGLLPEL